LPFQRSPGSLQTLSQSRPLCHPLSASQARFQRPALALRLPPPPLSLASRVQDFRAQACPVLACRVQLLSQ
jgi:hypothetical protein